MKPAKNQTLQGASWVLVSAFFFAGYGIWSKLMMGVFGEFNQAGIRAFILLAILIPTGLIANKFKKISRKDLKWFAVIGLSGGLNQAPYYYGFKYLNVGTATLLFYTFLTIGTYILGKLFFKEKITPVKYLALILSVVGIYYIYSFSLRLDEILPAFLASIAGFMGASGVVFSKKVSGRYSELQILLTYALVMLPANFLLSFFAKESLPLFSLSIPWFSAFAYAISLLVANFAVINGFKYLEPSIGGLIGLFEILFAVIFGIVLFKETVGITTIMGGGLVLTAIALPELYGYFKLQRRVR